MSDEKTSAVIERIDSAIEHIKTNKFTFYFFVVDSKGVPNGSLAYIYNLAKTLHDNGYNVQMLYQVVDEYTKNELYQLNKKNKPINTGKVFTGVGDWLGQEYAELPHMNISTEEWTVGAYDFLFIPEAFANLMFQTYKYNAPCKRIVIMNNFDYITDFLPLGVEWKDYGIHEAITTSETQSKLLTSVFPYVTTHVISPSIPQYFRKPLLAKNLIVNIVAKDQRDIDKIVKPFFWKHQMFKFVTFRELRNLPRREFAEKLQEGCITIWIDEDSPFGYSALESMRCGSIVIGKIPSVMPEWMSDSDNQLINNGFWTYDIKAIPDILAKVVSAWMRDEMPQEIYDRMEETNAKYTDEYFTQSVLSTFDGLIKKQIGTLNEVRAAVNNNETLKTDE